MQLPLLALWLAEGLAALLACRFVSHYSSRLQASSKGLWTVSAVYALCVVLSMMSMRLFSRRQREKLAGLLLRISLSVAFGSLIAGILISTWARAHDVAGVIAIAAALSWIGIVTIRCAGLRFIDESRFKRRILIYGTGRQAMKLCRLRRRSDRRGFELVGFMQPPGEPCLIDSDRLLQPNTDLTECALKHSVDEIVVAMDDRRLDFPTQQLLESRAAGLEVIELINFLERETGKVHLDLLYPSWIIFGHGFTRNTSRAIVERIFDLLVSALILVAASPLLLLTAVAIKLEDGLDAPVFYRQRRVGFGGRVFDVLKFRSMRVDAETNGAQWAEVRDSRITKVGGLIRRMRLDEFPQLLNVFNGEMSFVGPRPERPEFVAGLNERIPFYHQRHSVKPGITGWAQLCYSYGASETDAKEKLQYDLYYVKHHSLLFDLVILLQTVEVVLFGTGAR